MSANNPKAAKPQGLAGAQLEAGPVESAITQQTAPKSVDGKSVTYAVLHYPIHTPGTGQVGPTLSSNISNAGAKQAKMTLELPFVRVIIDNQGKKTTLMVPLTSFTHMVVDETNSTPV